MKMPSCIYTFRSNHSTRFYLLDVTIANSQQPLKPTSGRNSTYIQVDVIKCIIDQYGNNTLLS